MTVRRHKWLSLQRDHAWTDQDNRCLYCHGILKRYQATTDHVVPQIKHGSDDDENIVCACSPCNRVKGSLSKAIFLKAIKCGYLPDASLERSFYICMAWMRRKINIRTDRAVKNIGRAVA